jgi:hypothetical protein
MVTIVKTFIRNWPQKQLNNLLKIINLNNHERTIKTLYHDK